MSSTSEESHGSPEGAVFPDRLPTGSNGWRQVEASSSSGIWMRKVTMHGQVRYDRLKLTEIDSRRTHRFSLHLQKLDEYGLSEGGRRLHRTRNVSERDAEWILDKAEEHMAETPGESQFTSPSFPKSVDAWELSNPESHTIASDGWEWESNYATVRVEPVERRSVGWKKTQWFYTVSFEDGNGTVDVRRDAVTRRDALDAALTCIRSMPDGWITDTEALKQIHGVGDATARRLRVFGITSVHDLRESIRALDRDSLRSAAATQLSKLLTTAIRKGAYTPENGYGEGHRPTIEWGTLPDSENRWRLCGEVSEKTPVTAARWRRGGERIHLRYDIEEDAWRVTGNGGTVVVGGRGAALEEAVARMQQ